MLNNNLWAPWRYQYLEGIAQQEAQQLATGPAEDIENLLQDDNTEPCFICRYLKEDSQRDRENLVLWRNPLTVVLFNRYPYTGGHLLIAPQRHLGDLTLLDEATIAEMMRMAVATEKLLRAAIKPQGFNIGINIGKCSGAGLPGHVHMHVVPRWIGDTNFMSTTGNSRVISQGLEDLYDKLIELSAEMNLPGDHTDV